MSALQRPFKVLGIQQIAIGGPDKTRMQKLWVEMLGLEVTGTFKSERTRTTRPCTCRSPIEWITGARRRTR